MEYTNYEFYMNEYKGNAIPEADFGRLVTRASAYLKSIKIEIIDNEAKMAACAVAEAWQTNEQGGDLVSQSVGSWSKSFNKESKSDNDRLFEAAKLYLGDRINRVRWA